MLHLIDPVQWRGFWRWAEYYCIVEQQWWSGHAVDTIVGWRAVRMPELWREIEPLYLRREKSLLPLPPRTYDTVRVRLTAAERKRYDIAEKELLLEFQDHWEIIPSVAVKLTRVRQLLGCHQVFGHEGLTTKQRAVCDLAEDILHDSPKVVVFTWYQETAEAIGAELNRRKLSTTVVHGDVKLQERH